MSTKKSSSIWEHFTIDPQIERWQCVMCAT